jgi:hypothetical protein
MASILKPEGSITLGAATAALVYGVYSTSLPSTAHMHATAPHDINIELARKKAAWTTTALVSAIALMTRDKTVFVLGGVMVIALDWHARHANASSPITGKVVSMAGPAPEVPDVQDYAPAAPDEAY